jgi:hypothetical protein
MMRTALGGLIGFALFAAMACSSAANTTAGSESGGAGDHSTGIEKPGSGASPSADGLVGIWQSAPFTAADVRAALRGRFKDSVIDEAMAYGGCLARQGKTYVTTLHFGAGQLVISSSVNGGSSHEGWSGSYAVQDPDTFAAGDASNLYITVDYKVDGDQLVTDLIADRFPDHTPWSDSQDGPGSEDLTYGKVVADQMCAVEIYDTTPFTKAG